MKRWFLVGLLWTSGCLLDPENEKNGGTQIGSLDCSQDLIEIRLRDEDNNALQGEVEYAHEEGAVVALLCPYTCSITEPEPGAYEMTAIVDEISLTEQFTFGAEDEIPATEECPAYYERIVRFEFAQP